MFKLISAHLLSVTCVTSDIVQHASGFIVSPTKVVGSFPEEGFCEPEKFAIWKTINSSFISQGKRADIEV